MAKKLTDAEIDAALEAIEHARSVRKLHRRRTEKGSRNRQTDIRVALAGLQKAMKPVRSFLSSCQYGPQSTALSMKKEKVQIVSNTLQAERRKLWKMQK